MSVLRKILERHEKLAGSYLLPKHLTFYKDPVDNTSNRVSRISLAQSEEAKDGCRKVDAIAQASIAGSWEEGRRVF